VLERRQLALDQEDLEVGLERDVLVADRRVLDRLQQVVRYEIGLVGLASAGLVRALARWSAAAR
jgi:hypothetical protein